MDLSKPSTVFHMNYWLAKIHAYGFDLNSLTFFYSYLKNRKQNVKINNTCSILSVVPQESVLAPIVFNIFIIDLLMSTKNSDLHNFADDNTITNSSGILSQLIKNLQREANKATDWFKMNNMIVNTEKFQAMIIHKKGQNNNPTGINIDWKKSILNIVSTY